MREFVKQYWVEIIAGTIGLFASIGVFFVIYKIYAIIFSFIYHVFSGTYHLLDKLIDKI